MARLSSSSGDTWLAASTWRLPWKGQRPADDYVPGDGISFEEAVAWRKRQGYNSISFISAFPNWDADQYGATYANKDGVFLRNAWEKFGYWAPNARISTADGATTTGKDMHDEQGNRPFEVLADREGLANFDRVNPAYFRSLDRKMRHLSEQGFVPFLETIRRDNAPSWKRYFNFNESYARFVQYLVARYGAYNLVFSGIHLDWIPKDFSLTAEEFNEALTFHHRKYGACRSASPTPRSSTVRRTRCSATDRRRPGSPCTRWATIRATTPSTPRSRNCSASSPRYPAANLEPYYTGWNHRINRPGGETPAENSDRDNYFARAMMYGSVLSGALAGHVHGTAAYDVTSTGEPAGWRPHIWTALRYESGAQMRHLQAFVLSEGPRYQELTLASQDLETRSIPDALADGLDGWSFLMRSAGADFALVYFENRAPATRLRGFTPGANYRWTLVRSTRRAAGARSCASRPTPTGRLASPDFPSAAVRPRRPRVTWRRKSSGGLEPELRIAVVNVVRPIGRTPRVHRTTRLDQRAANGSS